MLSMKILLKNAKILTMIDENIFNGDVSIENNRILKVSKTRLKDKDFDQVIDCEGNLLMPGFKNAHAHSAMTFLRSVADDSSLHDWLFKEIFPREDNLHDGCIRELSKVAILEYLTSGITACIDQYFFIKEFKETCLELGFRSVTLGMYDNDSRPTPLLLDYYKEFNDTDLAKMVIGLHSEYTIDQNMIDETAILLKKTKSPFYVHLSETSSEVSECIKRRGKTPLEFFDSLNFFENGGAIFHGVYLSEHDYEILRDKNIVVVSCPASNMKLASGICDITTLLEKGCTVALGTDGPASNNGLDMFREMYLATGLQKLLYKNPVSIPAFEILKMATVNGAKAMNLPDAMYLAEGQLADIIMIDLQRPSMQPINNILNNIVYSGSKDVIKMTMINGKILYFNGKFLIKESISDIYSKVQKFTEELKYIK